MMLGILGAAIIALRLHDDTLRAAVAPPSTIENMSDFRQWRPQYDRAFKMETGGAVYYLVHGERGRLLASGPSGYVCDQRGNLVGWIQDTGDDHFIRIVRDETRRSALPLDRIAAARGAP